MLENQKSGELRNPLAATYICTSALLEHSKSLKPMPAVVQCPRSHKFSNTPHSAISPILSSAFPEHHCGQGSKPETRPLAEHLHPTARYLKCFFKKFKPSCKVFCSAKYRLNLKPPTCFPYPGTDSSDPSLRYFRGED